MSKYNWKSGFPPHIGFWLTCGHMSQETSRQWRWFDGIEWSMACTEEGEFEDVERYALQHTLFKWETFLYCDYWPENARVPRLVPEV